MMAAVAGAAVDVSGHSDVNVSMLLAVCVGWHALWSRLS